jgi:DNA integrity scanning protein DisA with diadenylate cyclase activity
MSSELPPLPDFAALEAAAPQSAERQNHILTMIGSLVFSWSNNESMFVYILMLLLDTDEVSAAIVFTTLNTTRARLELVRRLATVKLRDPAAAQGLARLIKRFDACTRVRNEFNHCVYSLNEKGEIVGTQLMRVQEERGRLSLGQTRPMDQGRVAELEDTNRQLKRLNRDLWAFLPQLKNAMMKAADDQRS